MFQCMAFLDQFSFARKYATQTNGTKNMSLKCFQREKWNDEFFSNLRQLVKVLSDIAYDNLQRIVASTFVEWAIFSTRSAWYWIDHANHFLAKEIYQQDAIGWAAEIGGRYKSLFHSFRRLLLHRVQCEVTDISSRFQYWTLSDRLRDTSPISTFSILARSYITIVHWSFISIN
jgi:hypothetical protein